MDVPAAAAGRIAEVLLKRGDKVSEGTVIARLKATRRPARLADSPATAGAPAGAAGPAADCGRRPQGAAGPGRQAGVGWRHRADAHAGPDEAAAGRGRLQSLDAAPRARLGTRWLHRRIPRRGPRHAGDARGAVADARRRLSQRWLHSLQGPAACGESHRGRRGDGHSRHRVRGAGDRPREAARLEGLGRQETDWGPARCWRNNARSKSSRASAGS